MDLQHPMQTVTPTVDGDVLTALATYTSSFTTGQLKRVVGRYSDDGIRKALRRLALQGVVLSERVGNAYAFRLNPDHLATEHIVAIARLRDTFLERLRGRLSTWESSPVYAAVFGSAARGPMTAASDIDILLVRPAPGEGDGELWEEQVYGLTAEVTRWTGNDARVVEFTRDEVATRGAAEPMLRDVLDHGLTIAGDRSWLHEQIKIRTD